MMGRQKVRIYRSFLRASLLRASRLLVGRLRRQRLSWRQLHAPEDEPNMIPVPARIDTIRRRQRLGGLLNEYRAAA
jgi:hypothetical protein